MPRHIYIFLLFIATLISCGGDRMTRKLEEIKSTGDRNPQLAMRMLDSLETKASDGSEYVRMRYDLLDMRLKDIANIKPTSDYKAKRLVEYFEKNGTVCDQQEAYYYAGSTYRDLHDTPRALENFFKSLEAARDTKESDSTMVRNTFSNLYYLYYNVQDYRNALKMSKKELEMSKLINDIQTATVMHLGNSYLALDSIRQARECFDNTLQLVSQSEGGEKNQLLYVLLHNYATIGDRAKADECYTILKSRDEKLIDNPDYNTLGTYFRFTGNTDAAMWCYEKTIATSSEDFHVYDAAKALVKLCREKGDLAAASRYADTFIQLSERLDLGRKQEMASTVGNEFQYHLDRAEMEKAEQWKRIYMRMVAGVSLLVIAVAFGFYIFYTKRKTAALRRQIELADKLGNAHRQQTAMSKELASKALQLEHFKSELASSEADLHDMNAKLDRYTADLQRAQEKLEEKRRQSQSLIQMLHRTELSAKAEEIVLSVKEAASGKRKLGKEEWQQLYAAVDSLYPGFRDTLVARLGTFTEQQMQVCYLMRIGLSNPLINNVVDISRSTVWRWTKAYTWIYGTDGNAD